ncbi:hypothetical protein Clacol_006280 [Clathrus columnatus]|uniref:Uncharacterized protein n=1 Tax=Clathrus columnatus TaxID=1419009 RepID=A0AAV5AH81_9AGAM|nr:hypothetical protein Clacol_006280 [Clathrus columnatus]
MPPPLSVASGSSDIINVAVKEASPNPSDPTRSTRHHRRNRRRHHKRWDQQENDIEWDDRRYYDPQSFSQYDTHEIEVRADERRVEDDTESVFAFKPPTTAEAKQFRVTQAQIPPSVVNAVASHTWNRSKDNSIDCPPRVIDQDLQTLVDYPPNLPQPALCRPGPCPVPSVVYRSSIHQDPRLHTLNEGAPVHSQTLSSGSPGSCCSPFPSNTHNSSDTRCRTHSEGHKSFQSRSVKNGSSKPRRHISDRKGEGDIDVDDDDRTRRNSAVSFEFDTESLYEESLKQRRWSYESMEDSPYPEVCASVSNTDDANMPVLTFRMWLIGLMLCCLSSGLNTFFYFRFPAPSITPLVLVLIAHPLGKFATYILPIAVFRLPRWLSRWCAIEEFSYNPGPWNIKEHACIYLMANVSIAPAYAMNTIVVAEQFYRVRLGTGFTFTLILATQLAGFGLAGLARRFLVWPASMIWPSNLVVCLGMGILTFDWSMISFIGSPLMIPWWAQVLAPILYYTNVWNLARFPMASNTPFDITGHEYNISKVVTSNHMLNATAYANYSPLYLPTTYVIAYLITFALSTCVLTHTVLYYGKSVWSNLRGIKIEEEDVHARLMRRYPEVDCATDASQIFKAYSVQSLSGALSFVQGLKLGHYIKTPPRASFLVQVVSTVATTFVQVFVKKWMFENIHDLCSPSQKDLLTCPHNEVYYTASAIWGLIGPGKQLGSNSIYRQEVYALLIGLLVPIPLWYWRRRRPDTRLPYISFPVIFNGPSLIPPGTILSICAVFFFLQIPHGGFSLDWAGNTVFTKTADWRSASLIPPS